MVRQKVKCIKDNSSLTVSRMSACNNRLEQYYLLVQEKKTYQNILLYVFWGFLHCLDTSLISLVFALCLPLDPPNIYFLPGFTSAEASHNFPPNKSIVGQSMGRCFKEPLMHCPALPFTPRQECKTVDTWDHRTGTDLHKALILNMVHISCLPLLVPDAIPSCVPLILSFLWTLSFLKG